MITGYTIGEYIRSRRLYLAAMDLIEKDEKIIDDISDICVVKPSYVPYCTVYKYIYCNR